jgi:uncharacterized protein
MRIAVISDTHDRVPDSLQAKLDAADEIWHLGDVCDPSVLTTFERPGVQLHVVLGNCDDCSAWPLMLSLERGGSRFLLQHIPPQRVPKGVQVVLHGHTHVPRDEVDPLGVRWLNPGCITRPNRGSRASFAWLTIKRNGFDWDLVRL